MPEPIDPAPEPAACDARYQQVVAEMVAALEAVRDLPGLEHLHERRALPSAFFERFNEFLRLYDELIDLALAASGDTQRIQCKKGCANCCIDLVRGITAPEIINIYHHVRGWDDVRELFEYHRESALRFMGILAAKLQSGETPPSGADPRVAEAHIAYNRLNRPCGFLDQENGCCRIYPVRPIACRYFFSLDPPETCTPLHVKYLNRRVRTVHLPDRIHELLTEINKRFGFRPLNYLPGAFCQMGAEIMHTRPITISDGPSQSS